MDPTTYITINTICVEKYLKENDPWIEHATLLNKGLYLSK